MNTAVARVEPATQRALAIILVVALAFIGAQIVHWSTYHGTVLLREDYGNYYTGASLWRTGSNPYDYVAQRAVYTRLLAPLPASTVLALPFASAPLTAALLAPVTLLPFAIGYRVWSLIGLALMSTGLLLGLAASNRRLVTTEATIIFLGLVATAPLWIVVTLGQWDPEIMAGLGLMLWCIRRDHLFAGGAVLVITAGIAKPDLLVGVAAATLVCLGWRFCAGGIVGGVVVLAATVWSVGLAGMGSFASAVAFQARAFESPSATLLTFLAQHVGLGSASPLVSTALDLLVTIGACGMVGLCARHSPTRLCLLMPVIVAASVVGSPHTYYEDFCLVLVPLATVAGDIGPRLRPALLFVALAWMVLNIAFLVGSESTRNETILSSVMSIAVAVLVLVVVGARERAPRHTPQLA